MSRGEVGLEERRGLCFGHGEFERYFCTAGALAEMTVANSLEADGVEVGFRYERFKTLDHGYGGAADGGWTAVCVWPWGFSGETAFEVGRSWA